MSKVLLTDSEILSAFAKTNNGKKTFFVEFVPMGKLLLRNFGEGFELTANTKKEALELAKEYGTRFLDKRVFQILNYSDDVETVSWSSSNPTGERA
jgi:hypothetical protein